MKDQRINELVRMAMEVDELEREAETPRLRLVGGMESAPAATPTGWRGSRWWAGAVIAAAAVLGISMVVPVFLNVPKPGAPIASAGGSAAPIVAVPAVPDSKGSRIVRSQRFVASTESPEIKQSESPPIKYPVVMASDSQPGVDPGSVEGCIVVAIYRDDHGAMHCVKVKPQEWTGNKCLSEVSQQELRCVSVGQPCSASADHAMLVALSGPQRSLPKTEADAVQLAGCILGSSGDGSRGYAHAAAECVPSDVSVKIETASDVH